MDIFADIQFNIQLKQFTFCHYQLKINDKMMKLTFPQLLQLRKKVNELTSPLQLQHIIDNDNYVLLFIADKEHLVFLEIPTLLELKEEISYCFSF